jgi:ribosomal protein S18 acetylase RimI-like enzyme
MSFYKITPEQLQSSDLRNFIETIFNNFIELLEYPELKHNRDEIYRILTSNNVHVLLYMIDGKIASYLIGETINLNDGRRVLYISYLYTALRFRGKRLASLLMEQAEEIVQNEQLDTTVLTCDTENSMVYNFYLQKGFMPDMILRNYSRHEVLSK